VISRLIFFTVYFGLTAAAHIYFYRRLARHSERAKKVGKRVFIALWAMLAISPLPFFFTRARWASFLSLGAWVWLGLCGLLLATLLLTDIARGAVLLWSRYIEKKPLDADRRAFLATAASGAALTATAGLGAYGVFRAYAPPEISEVVLKLPKLPRALDGFTIAHLTDLHVGGLIEKRFIADRVARCNAFKPDLVAITGDLVDGSVPALGAAVFELTKLQSRFGSYFVTGNHEYYSGDEAWCEQLSQWGMGVLRNRSVSIGNGKESFDLAGVDDWRGMGRRGESPYNLVKATSSLSPDRASILLAHQPKGFEEAVKRGVGLQLSGHTHGGQMFPLTLTMPFVYKHPAGLYGVDGSFMYVSRGTGFWGPPMRLGSPPEIVKVVLVSA
jgi:predicted MPP superfamily phosphohydrolase